MGLLLYCKTMYRLISGIVQWLFLPVGAFLKRIRKQSCAEELLGELYSTSTSGIWVFMLKISLQNFYNSL